MIELGDLVMVRIPKTEPINENNIKFNERLAEVVGIGEYRFTRNVHYTVRFLSSPNVYMRGPFDYGETVELFKEWLHPMKSDEQKEQERLEKIKKIEEEYQKQLDACYEALLEED